jgi:hypothetical protein
MQPTLGEHLAWITMVDKAVREPKNQRGNIDRTTRQVLEHGSASAPMNRVFLHGNEQIMLIGEPQYEVFIERFYESHVCHGRIQLLRRR